MESEGKEYELTDEQKISFLTKIFVFNDKQLDVFTGFSKMTYELFNECLEACIIADDICLYKRIWDKYPEFAKRSKEEVDKLEEEIKNDPLYHQLTEEESAEMWENIRKAVKEKCGDDIGPYKMK